MKFRFLKTIGQTQFTFEDECKDATEFFKKSAFYSELPSIGPNGETDLIVRHRIAKGYDFYSIESPKSKIELKFGQRKEEKGKLFPKEWEPVRRGKDSDEAPY